MYNICVNDEFRKSVIVNFEEIVDLYPDSIGECEDIMRLVEKKFAKIVDSVDEPQDGYYIVTCFNEDGAEEVEEYLENKFAQLEDELEN